jgi:uncharacterized membrane protein
MSLFIAVLFFLLTPGIVLSLPAGGSLLQKAAVHAVVFALVYHLTHKAVWNMLYARQFEYFEDAKKDVKKM